MFCLLLIVFDDFTLETFHLWRHDISKNISSISAAIFIIDAIHEVYLWLGWWPEEEDSENSDAQRMRWDVDKRKAMESVVLYAKGSENGLR